MATSKTCFVATGATVTFQKLIEASLSRQLIETLQKHGFGRLIIQFGKEPDGIATFSRCVEQLGAVRKPAGAPGADGTVKVELESGFQIEGFKFTTEIKQYMQQADLVITHGGTGLILDGLRSYRKVIVFVNNQLMDNHQLEIASEFEKEGYLLKCDCLEELVAHVETIGDKKLVELPQPNVEPLRKLMLSL